MTKAEIVQNLLNARQITPEQAVILLSPDPPLALEPVPYLPDDITITPYNPWQPHSPFDLYTVCYQ